MDVRRPDAELVEEDVAQQRIVVLPGVDQRRARQSRSSSGMIRLSRMISGRVPTTVTTFIAEASRSGVELGRQRRRQIGTSSARRPSRSSVMSPDEYSLVSTAPPADSGDSSGSIGQIT